MKRWVLFWQVTVLMSGSAFAKIDVPAQQSIEPISAIADLFAQTSPTPAPAQTPAPTTPSPTQAAPAQAPASPAPTSEDSVLPDLSPDNNSGSQEDGSLPPAGSSDYEDMNSDEITVVETTELSADMAKRAIDVYAVVREKYKDAEIDQYDNLQDFVDQNPRGKEFEADIKAAGFQSVNDWNLAITTASFTYMNVVDDQTDELKQQIEELKSDTETPVETKERLLKALTAMIPSENNLKVITELSKDPGYAEKIKLLEIEEE